MEIVAKVLRHIRCLTENLSGQCFDLLYLSGAFCVLLDRQIVPKLVLVLLLQEIDQELAASKNF